MKRKILFILLLASSLRMQAAGQSAEANAAFDQYIAQVESRLGNRHRSSANFLPIGSAPEMIRLHHGDVLLTETAAGKKVSGGLLHDWSGRAFVPGVTAADFLRLMQDPDHFPDVYRPQVVRSKLLNHHGDHLTVTMRLHYKKVIGVTLDTTYDVFYGTLDRDHGYSVSRSTQVREIADADSHDEYALAPGDDHGFLWRLNSYWTYEQQPDGLLLECEAVSLTRDIPTGLGWMVGPFVSSIPRESLEFTLTATRNALLSRRHYGN